MFTRMSADTGTAGHLKKRRLIQIDFSRFRVYAFAVRFSVTDFFMAVASDIGNSRGRQTIGLDIAEWPCVLNGWVLRQTVQNRMVVRPLGSFAVFACSEKANGAVLMARPKALEPLL